ncbi:class I SAM-dependent methyltransferase [Pseudonocardia sp. CA-107938]|uniref:class I SAM-dependent methyltransferase n=1 Tax=Pseudonocardia sp. CA-107938 TaxID=3240021 RepID=UPI003D94916D
MHRVIGKRVVELSPAEFAALRERHAGVLLDVGTGDGKHVLHVARQRPDMLVVGLDANADALRRTSARAAVRADRGGLPNVVFVRAAAERPPAGLSGVDEVHVLMPWGSLLRGTLGDGPVLESLAAVCAPGAPFLVTLNLHAWRPPVPEVGELPEPDPASALTGLRARYADAGWQLTGAEYLDDAGIAALATSWTKRLGSSRDQLDVLALHGTVG